MAKTGVLFEGRSRLDGAPIVMIATDGTRNEKTGNMIQTWILRSDMPPTDAVKTGESASVCGSCPLQGNGCYVLVHNAPLAVWKKYKRGGYDRITPADLAGRAVRLGSYGDPAAVPVSLLKAITSAASSWTGYTHSWKRFPGLRHYVMASIDPVSGNVDTLRAAAKRRGFRTFTIREEGADGEILCPSESRGISCEKCGLCYGAGAAKDIFIPAHGYQAKNVKGESNGR